METTQTPQKRGPKPRHTSRDAEIRQARAEGKTLQAIATQYGVSRQRICQIVNEGGTVA